MLLEISQSLQENICARVSILVNFQQILREQNEITVHQKNLQVFMAEVYKIVNDIAPLITNSLFPEIFTENRKTVKFGSETVMFQAPFL